MLITQDGIPTFLFHVEWADDEKQTLNWYVYATTPREAAEIVMEDALSDDGFYDPEEIFTIVEESEGFFVTRLALVASVAPGIAQLAIGQNFTYRELTAVEEAS